MHRACAPQSVLHSAAHGTQQETTRLQEQLNPHSFFFFFFSSSSLILISQQTTNRLWCFHADAMSSAVFEIRGFDWQVTEGRHRLHLLFVLFLFIALLTQRGVCLRKKTVTTKKTITFIYWFIDYTFHDIIAIYYYWQRYYNPIAFLYINTKSEVGPQRLMTVKINKCISHIWYIFPFLYLTPTLKHIFLIYLLSTFKSVDVMGGWRHISISIGSSTSHRTHRNIWHYSSN